jgi:hypothetical protein
LLLLLLLLLIGRPSADPLSEVVQRGHSRVVIARAS